VIEFTIGVALVGFGCGLVAKGPLAAAWWRGQVTLAEARVAVLEGELERERELRADGRDVYLTRLARCRGCATCNPEPAGLADLADYEFGAPE